MLSFSFAFITNISTVGIGLFTVCVHTYIHHIFITKYYNGLLVRLAGWTAIWLQHFHDKLSKDLPAFAHAVETAIIKKEKTGPKQGWAAQEMS